MENLMGRYRNITFFGAVIIFQILGLAIQIKRRSENDSARLIRVWTVTAITPLEKGIVGLQSGVGNVWHNYIYLRGVRQQNRDLQDKIQQLQLEQVRLRQDAEQARRLQTLLGFKEQFIDQTVAAQVIGSSGSEQSRTVYLDKGSNDGIKQGMPVISAEGVVGKIIQALPRSSQVLLISDQTSGVGTILEQSRLQGVLKGKASGEIVLDKVMAEEDVKVGERVLTSGGDQIFPKGLPVGTVGEVKRGGEFLQVTVKPATPLNHLEEVLVITKKQEREPQAAGASPVRAADILAQRLPSVPDKPAEPATGSVHPSGTGAVGTSQPKPVAPIQDQTQPGVASHTTATQAAPTQAKLPQPKALATGAETSPRVASGQAPKPAAPAPTAPAKPDGTTTQQPGQTDTGDTPQ
jgi:rod shape-determining protein MreC